MATTKTKKNARIDKLAEARVAEIARTHLVGIETLEPRHSDRLDFHEVSVGTLSDALRAAYLAGRCDALAAANGRPTDKPTDQPILDTLGITSIKPRKCGGTWVLGTIDEHHFEALVFEQHAENEAFELGDTRISKLFIRDIVTYQWVLSFDRGWDIRPATPRAAAILDVLGAGLAERVFGN